MSTWYDRLKTIREENGLSQADLGEKIGTDDTAISRYEKGAGAQNLTFKFKQKLTKVFNNEEIHFIETGDRAKTDSPKSTESIIDTNKFISVPIVSAKASGSPVGEIHYDVEIKGEVSIAKMLFKTMPNINNIQAIEVIGNSMSPRINPGDYVIVDKKDNFDHDGVYVLQFDSMLLVKRLQVTTRGIKIISDNRSYDEDVYDPNDDQRMMHIVGKVILVINRDMASF